MTEPAAWIASNRCYRALFVSDVHLGCRYSQAEAFLSFLNSIQVDRLYLVGDFIDGWRLRRRWHWQLVYVQIFQRLVEMATQGTEIFYTPGNHDEFLRDYFHDFGWIRVADQFVHQTLDGRRLAVLHGDKFDDFERQAKWLSKLGSIGYDGLIRANSLVNLIRRGLCLEDCRFSSQVKVWTKQAVQFISDFEERLICHAKDTDCDGVICGHIHVPRLDRVRNFVYCNTGDWVEHCTALVEHVDGELELIEWVSSHPVSLRRERDFADQQPRPEVSGRIEELAASIGSPRSDVINSLHLKAMECFPAIS